VREQVRLMGRAPVLLSMAATVCGAAGGLMTYTYIAPITRDLTGTEGPVLALFIAIAGGAGAAGTILGGRLTDRWAADRTLLVAFCGQLGATVVLAGIGLLGGGAAPAWTVAAALALWGLAGWAYNPPMNTRALLLGGAAGSGAVALNTSGLYLGVALGGALGGTALAAGGGTGVVLLAAAIGTGTLALLAWSVRRHPSGHVPSGAPTDVREAG
jgi:predicted MFS family arabinose efflux permease